MSQKSVQNILISFLYRALENYSRFRQRRGRFPILAITSADPDTLRSSLVPPYVSFNKLTFGFPISMNLRMSSFSATLSVILKSCNASDCQLKRDYAERSAAFSCDPHKSSTVNPPHFLTKFLLAAAASLAVAQTQSNLNGCVSATPLCQYSMTNWIVGSFIVDSFVVLKKCILLIPRTSKILKKDVTWHPRR